MSELDAMASLRAAMSCTADGWGAVIDGVLDPRTVTTMANGAAVNALYLCGHKVLPGCSEPSCDCVVKVAAKIAPQVRIVRVRITVAEDQP